MTPKICTFERIIPMIYAYSTPRDPEHVGWLKIGYTEKQTVEERIKQQTHTADTEVRLEWKNNAMYTDGSGETFKDRQFHDYLTIQHDVERKPGKEWFKISVEQSLKYFYYFASRRQAPDDNFSDYELRKEQNDAVEMTRAYFENGGKEFLWNAKPRFGKTLTAYDLIRRMNLKNVLIVTNRPAIANSWAEDFYKFIGWRGELCFVSETDALKDKKGVMSREDYTKASRENHAGMVAFESLQGLKGSKYFGGIYPKLEWMAKDYYDENGAPRHGLKFDLLIVDESQEGVDTIRTDKAFGNISRKYTLYLSGTPFKQLASEQFSEKQIFNWSYADEQEAKANWTGDAWNPYERLPKMSMFTYELSPMIYEKLQRGVDLSDDETVNFAFDLNEFFATNESGKFVHEDEVKKFLRALTTQEKYPFSTPELCTELSHTLWLLNRVASVKALYKLLKEDPTFSEYEIVIAAGDGKADEDDETKEKAFDRVKKAIEEHEKTITLSVGQLTVGVTIPQWSGVLMLCNMQSPSSYMQAAFRAQNPCELTDGTQHFRKETAYVFDFDPARTLTIFDDFANNLSRETVSGRGTTDERKANIKRLLNFFPVIGEDSEGKMVELNATDVLSIPRRLKSQEVVRRGFMSNFLFQNISNVFGAPGIVRQIVEKLTPAKDAPPARTKRNLSGLEEIEVDENGNTEVSNEKIIGKAQDIFGEKVYEKVEEDLHSSMEDFSQNAKNEEKSDISEPFKILKDQLKESAKENVVKPVVDSYRTTKRQQDRMERQVEQAVEENFNELHDDYVRTTEIAKVQFEKKCEDATSSEELQKAREDYASSTNEALDKFMRAAQDKTKEIFEEKQKELVEQMERLKADKERKTVEDTIRDHLRGFSRTIPSFIMAYGDGKLTLANFDKYTEEDVFEEVTGITLDNFRFLRDGGDYTDPETGVTEYFAGHLFDEVVFDDSIEEFWKKKTELANYFNEAQEEDIFDYIPPQRTNQIFTPRWVVVKMVDLLEENNPGCFDDPSKTFADLYMKSGLYITEIVKRLFRSEGMKKRIPDDGDRIRHILREQVFGMAPTRIIYLIATNYILGFSEKLKSETKNFVQADAAQAAKDDKLQELVDKYFG